MKHKLASGLLIASVLAWGLWCGGRVSNPVSTVPLWSASPPETFELYRELLRAGAGQFFLLVPPFLVGVVMGSMAAAW